MSLSTDKELKLLGILKNKDHWETLDEIAESLEFSASKLKKFAESLEDIKQSRQAIPYDLVEAMIWIEVLKVKISIMPSEWDEKRKEVIEAMLSEYEPVSVTDFSEMEF